MNATLTETARTAGTARTTTHVHRVSTHRKDRRYNGHKNWNHWNVSLWINNDEGLYNQARACVRRAHTKAQAAAAFVESLAECGITKTPDGAPYSVTAVRAAMFDM